MRTSFPLRPFDVDVAHFLPADADIIQDDITGVPDDATQEQPERESKTSTIYAFYRCIDHNLFVDFIPLLL